jgi:hypothetical protein
MADEGLGENIPSLADGRRRNPLLIPRAIASVCRGAGPLAGAPSTHAYAARASASRARRSSARRISGP